MNTIPTPIWFVQYEDEHLAEELENLDRADAADRQSWEEWCDAVDLDELMERWFPSGDGETVDVETGRRGDGDGRTEDWGLRTEPVRQAESEGGEVKSDER